MIILETERLQLREFTLDDATALAPVLEVVRLPEYKDLTLLEYTKGFLEHRILPSYKKDGFGLWAVIHKETGKLSRVVHRLHVLQPQLQH